VPAYVVEPIGPGPHAGIIFGHWGEGVRTEFLDEAMFYAKAGAVSVLIDYPSPGPRPLTSGRSPTALFGWKNASA
jgi:hypothetical protein